MMSTATEQRMRLGSFACEFGDRERAPESIEGIAAICAARGLTGSLATMGCGMFWQMTRPIESYITRCVSDTIAASGVPATAISHIVFSTMDDGLRRLERNFVRTILRELGLVNCIPVLMSMQQCAGSLAALDHARRLLADANVHHVIVVAFDFVVDDAERIHPFALFGDAVASCMMSRGDAAGLSLIAYKMNTDFAGIMGTDSFESRKRVAVATLNGVLEDGGTGLKEVEKCFSTNFYKPIATFNAGVCGLQRGQLCIDTLNSRAHCGNCDWMINLIHHQRHTGMTPGKRYLVQSLAPGFFACGLLEAPA